jgi:anti-sigma regulatory factor (Ser/Thr protein kinase)
VVALDALGSFEALVPAELGSVVAARRLVESAARTWGIPDPVADDAALVMSELVTNAVMHAGTPVQVVVRRMGQGLRLEVGDGSSRLPVVGAERPEDLLSTRSMTGRGLAVVAATVDRWGADPSRSGKVMWAEIGTGRRHVTAIDSRPSLVPPSLATSRLPAAAWAGVTEVTAIAAEGRRVHLIGVPVRLLIESSRQLADLQREIQFFGLDPRGSGGAASDLARTSREISAELSLPQAGRDVAEAAMARGEALVDVDVDLPWAVVAAFDRLGSIVRRVGETLGGEHLLTVPPSEEVNAYRRWCRDEITAQLTGRPPRPCPFADAVAS